MSDTTDTPITEADWAAYKEEFAAVRKKLVGRMRHEGIALAGVYINNGLRLPVSAHRRFAAAYKRYEAACDAAERGEADGMLTASAAEMEAVLQEHGLLEGLPQPAPQPVPAPLPRHHADRLDELSDFDNLLTQLSVSFQDAHQAVADCLRAKEAGQPAETLAEEAAKSLDSTLSQMDALWPGEKGTTDVWRAKAALNALSASAYCIMAEAKMPRNVP